MESQALPVTGRVAADVLTIKNAEGGFTIQDAQGRYFYLEGAYNSLNVSAKAPAEGGKYIKYANAQYSGKPQYLEVYSGYLTVYGLDTSKADIYVFALENA